MMFNTSEWMRLIKKITIDLKTLQKRKKVIMRMNKTYEKSLGIDKTSDDYLEERESIEDAFILGSEGSEYRSSELDEIRKKIDLLQKQLFAIKCVALSRATKLSREAKRKGFLDNVSYRNALIAEKRYTEEELLAVLEAGEDVWSFDMFDMSQKDANKISNKRR